jgi:hypothetical protein
MTDETSIPPYAPSTPDAAEPLRDAAGKVRDMIDAGRKPGMPLSILSNIVREAPLGSLMIAFLLGVAVARRR